MKSRYSVFALLLVAVILCSCSKNKIFTPEQAKNHIGQHITIRGRVTEVYETSKGTAFLDMGGRYPNNAFSAVIFHGDRFAFGDIFKYQGKVISVSGKVSSYNGRTEIILTDEKQIHE